MEFVILGLLLLKPMTGYEIGTFIRKNLSMICSSSAGSVQTAIKKLLANESIEFNEFVEKSKNKKVFNITEKGKKDFNQWISTPMQTEKKKNMELSKLFFLGFADINTQIEAVKEYISQLENTKEALIIIKNQFAISKNSIPSEIAQFNEYTLKFGIDSATFEINWYKNLLNDLNNEGE